MIAKRRKSKIALLSLSIMTALSMQAYAEEDFQLNEVVVTATRTERAIKDTPASVEVITRKDMETMGADSVVAALKLAMNINLSEAGMVGNQVSLRGMNTNQSLILINGRRIAGEDTGSTANAYELNRININNVERIEIVRGPVSSLYGSDALGGVINIITRTAEKQQTTVSLTNGSILKSGGVHFDSGKDGKWVWATDVNLTDLKKRTRYNGNTALFGKRNFYNISGTYDLDENKKIDLFVEKMEETPEYLAISMGKKLNYKYDTERNSYGVTYRGETEKKNYEIRTYYNELEKMERVYNLTAGNTPSSFDRMHYKTWVMDGKNTIQLDDNHLLTYGGEYRSLYYRGTRLGTAGNNDSIEYLPGFPNQNSSEKTIKYKAAYIQDEWKLSNKLLVIPSVRYDDSNNFGDDISPKIGLTYQLNDHYRLKSNFGKGFRAPTISELYLDYWGMGGMYHIVGNSDLKPERSKTYDVSLEGEQGGSFGKLTYFHNNVDNMITTKPIGSVQQYVNINKAKIDGIEFQLGQHLNSRLTLKGAYTYLDAKDSISGTRLNDRANNRYSLQLHYDDSQNTGVSGILWHEWVRDYQYSNVNYNYNLLNLTVNKKWNQNYSTYIGVDNILDKKVNAIFIDGRLWKVGMNITL